MSEPRALARPAALTLLFFAFVAAFVAVIIVLVPRPALATQPPPPATYELTITKVGGDDNCKFGAEPPTRVQYEVTQFQRTYTASTDITLRQIIDCPSEYRFDHWESNEDDVDGHIDLQEVTFSISKNTWVKAHFVALNPRVTDHHNTGMFMDSNGYLTVDYEWSSTDENLASLQGQKIIEVLSHDTEASFDPDVLAFLCTGADSSSETVTFDPPWDQAFGPVPRFKTSHNAGASAASGQASDRHGRPARPSGCTSSCTYSVRQWYVAGKNGGQYYLVGGPYEITRNYEYVQGKWIYTITKHGQAPYVIVP